MLVLTRGIAAVLLLTSCDQMTERKLVGTWRAEKDGVVDEVAFRADHTLIWWMCPAELSTPQTFVSSGEWRVRNKQIEIDSKQLTSPAPTTHHSLQILELSKDSLLVKITNENSTVGFKRLDEPSCPTLANGSTPVAVDPNILGTWQVHYHTHDFRYRFAPDHNVTVAGLVSGEFNSLWKGSWSVSDGDLLMDLKPDARSMGEQKPHWQLHGFQHDCFRIKDHEGIEYVVHRTE